MKIKKFMFHFIFSLVVFFFFLAVPYGVWVSQPWINPGSLKLETQSINHWIIRDVFSEIFNKRIEILRSSQDKKELVLSLIFKTAAIKFIKSMQK